MKNGLLIGRAPLFERLVVSIMWPKFYAEILNMAGGLICFFIFMAFMLAGPPILHYLNLHDGIIIILGLPSILLGLFIGSRFFAYIIPIVAPISVSLKNYDVSKRKAQLRYWLHEEHLTDNMGNQIPLRFIYQAIGANGYCMLIVKPNTLSDEWPPQPIKFRIAKGLYMTDVLHILNTRIKKYSINN